MPPNIVLIVAADQRATAVGCESVELVQTPNLDALAQRGTRCTAAYHFGSCVPAVCAPSRAMLHTGIPYTEIDPALMGPVRPPTDRNVPIPPTLGEKLRRAGYHCFGTGKWHNGVETFARSFDSGDAIFFYGMADHWFTPAHAFDPSGSYPETAARNAPGHSTDVFGQTAVDFIQSQRDRENPFFCYCAFTSPHDPRTPPDAYRRMYDPRQIDLPPNFLPEHPFDNGELEIRDERLLGRPRDTKEIQRSLAAYYAMISHMDTWIGRICEAVDSIGKTANTLVVHTADHGLALGQHGLLGKQNMYEHSVRVPLILAGPGVPEGRRNPGLCYQHDLHPTLLEFAGIPDEGRLFTSLLPLLNGKTPGRNTVVSAYRDCQRMIRGDRLKLIEYRVSGDARRQVFDLTEDPWERNDRAEDSHFAEEIARLAYESRRRECSTGRFSSGLPGA